MGMLNFIWKNQSSLLICTKGYHRETERLLWSKSACLHSFDLGERSRDDFCRRASHRSSVNFHDPQSIGLFPNKKQIQRNQGKEESAVLIPLVNLPSPTNLAGSANEKANEPWIILTRRSSHLRAHPGEICFPGGKLEAESRVEAALRETNEEIGLQASEVDVWGCLRPLLSNSNGRLVTPVVGVLRNCESLTHMKAKTNEVESIFLAPMSELVSSIHYTTFKIPPFTYTMPVFFTNSYRVISPKNKSLRLEGPIRIWGLTAAIFYEALCTILPNSEDLLKL